MAKSKYKEPIRKLTPANHRAILNFLNDAVRAEDLVYGRQSTAHVHPAETHPEHIAVKKKQILELRVADAIMKCRVERFPLGFTNIRDLLEAEVINERVIGVLISCLGSSTMGEWDDFPLPIPLRGKMTYTGVLHAALLKNGKVLFITADETTLLWNPEDTTAATFEDPVNQPRSMPGGYPLLCGHHVHLSDSDGSLLAVGGGGYGPDPLAKAGYIFVPDTKTWTRTANDMEEHKWYPTAVSLGGNRVLVTCGNTAGHMEIFDENSKTFQPVSGDDYRFPNLYPGLHLLPNNSIFYSRTGWGTATAGAGGVALAVGQSLGGRRPAYFTFDSPNSLSGTWQEIQTAAESRVKGMSVLLLSPTPPFVRILVMGGSDVNTNDHYEILDASVLSPGSSFDPPVPFPDGEHRSLCSGVLLPDGKLFVCGGIQSPNSRCTLFDPVSNTWSDMATLASVRDYHSVAILLPSAKVMVAGWNNTTIEIYSPPYLFDGPQPTISSAPNTVHHGSTFTIESPDADTIVKVVFVRPMAVTHQTDSEQKVIELLPFVHDHVNPTRITLTAPDGGHPHPIAQRGHYMMFAINNLGVPSVAKWVYLH